MAIADGAFRGNIIVGGVVIYTEQVQESFQKKLIVVALPTSSTDGKTDPKGAIIVDLLRVEPRLIIRGWIDSSDRTAFKNLVLQNRIVSISWDGDSTLRGAVEKSIMTTDKSEQDERFVQLTVVIGEDYAQGDGISG